LNKLTTEALGFKVEKTLAANYTNFRGLKKKFALNSEIRGKRFAMCGSKKL